MEHNKLLSYNLARCPLCHEQMSITKNSFICNQHHCYDIAKTGYVNFYMGKDKVYTGSLFHSRKSIYEAHFYDPLVNIVNEMIEEIFCRKSIVILDAGCGEGFFTDRIGKSERAAKIGFDISKEAVRLASKKTNSVLWMVADLNNIPVTDKCVDIVLDILSPANYNEFARVLKDDGIIIKVIPCSNYLAELRELVKEQLKNATYSNHQTKRCFLQHADLLKAEKVSYHVPVDNIQVKEFANMTPLLEHIDKENLALETVKFITIELEVLIGRIKNQ